MKTLIQLAALLLLGACASLALCQPPTRPVDAHKMPPPTIGERLDERFHQLTQRTDELDTGDEVLLASIQGQAAELEKLRAEIAALQPPTAAELSQPGALQEYVDSMLAATGDCPLPGGAIKISEANPLVIPAIQSGIIRGVGVPYTHHDQESGWNDPDNDCSTRFVSTDGTGIVFGPCIGVTLAGFSVEGAEIGILYPPRKGWGATMNTLDRIALIGNAVGFQAGRDEYDGNCSGVIFRTVLCRDNDRGIVIKNNQGVNYVLESLCYFKHNVVGIDLEHGGRLRVRDAKAYGGEVFIRTGETSSGQIIVDGLAWDRLPPGRGDWVDPLPILFDGRATRHSQLHVKYRNVSVNGRQWKEEIEQEDGTKKTVWRREGDDGEHHFFLMPEYAEGRSWQTGDFEPVHGVVDKQCSEVVYE